MDVPFCHRPFDVPSNVANLYLVFCILIQRYFLMELVYTRAYLYTSVDVKR